MDIFPKGLVHGFGPILSISSPYVLGNIGQKNVFYDILEQKNTFLGYNKTRISKGRNIDIFPKGLVQLILVQYCPFLHHICLGNIGQKNVFYDILEKKRLSRL